jgi:hypothetical protein
MLADRLLEQRCMRLFEQPKAECDTTPPRGIVDLARQSAGVPGRSREAEGSVRPQTLFAARQQACRALAREARRAAVGGDDPLASKRFGHTDVPGPDARPWRLQAAVATIRL